MPIIKHVCDDCSGTWNEIQLKTIENIEERVAPGESMPSGECPECGAVCHPQTFDLRARFKVVESDADFGAFHIFGETREMYGLDGLYETAINDALDFARTIAALTYPGEDGVLKTSDMQKAVERLKAVILQARALDCVTVDKEPRS